jgi:hypothetical protein
VEWKLARTAAPAVCTALAWRGSGAKVPVKGKGKGKGKEIDSWPHTQGEVLEWFLLGKEFQEWTVCFVSWVVWEGCGKP